MFDDGDDGTIATLPRIQADQSLVGPRMLLVFSSSINCQWCPLRKGALEYTLSWKSDQVTPKGERESPEP